MTAIERNSTPITVELAGIHHVGLTVSDVEASAAWYQRVFGLDRQFEEPHHESRAGGHCVVLATPDHRVDLGLDHHPGNAGERFDPTRTGLDHLSLRVASVEELRGWATHLAACGVHHSGVYRMPGMPISLLTFEDPDGIQLELIALEG